MIGKNISLKVWIILYIIALIPMTYIMWTYLLFIELDEPIHYVYVECPNGTIEYYNSMEDFNKEIFPCDMVSAPNNNFEIYLTNLINKSIINA